MTIEENKLYRHEYYLKNKDKFIARAKEWARNNKEKRKDIVRKYCIESRDKKNRNQDKYRKANPLKYLYCLAKRRAIRRDIEFNIKVEDLGVVPDRCPLLDIPIDSYSLSNDYRPSIDRIDSSKGYIEGNVHVISWKANRLKNSSCGNELLYLAVNLIVLEGGL